MSELEPAPMEEGALVLVSLARGAKSARERALVLRAIDIPYLERRTRAGFELWVPAERASDAQRELAQYTRENANWPPPDGTPHAGALWREATLGFALVLLVAYALDHLELFGVPWDVLGRVDSARLRAGEGWRVVTALTLHAGAVHVLSNLVYGALFGGLAAWSLGGGVGWLAITLTGALGNAFNAWIVGGEHLSIGASTAVFGAVGLLCGSEAIRRHLLRERRLRRAAPILVAFLLLGSMGMGDMEYLRNPVDITAHVCGLLVGLLLGVPLGLLPARLATDRRVQAWSALAALGLIVLAWASALAL